MKTMVKLLFLLTVLLAFSCRSIKTVEKVATKTDSLAIQSLKTASHVDAQNETAITAQDNSTTTDSSTETRTEIALSKPDSTGKQFPTSITVTEKTTGRKSQSNIKEQYQSSANLARDDTGNGTQATHATKNTTTDKNKASATKTPLWVILAVAILSVGLLILVYLVLKRFKLIK